MDPEGLWGGRCGRRWKSQTEGKHEDPVKGVDGRLASIAELRGWLRGVEALSRGRSRGETRLDLLLSVSSLGGLLTASQVGGQLTVVSQLATVKGATLPPRLAANWHLSIWV